MNPMDPNDDTVYPSARRRPVAPRRRRIGDKISDHSGWWGLVAAVVLGGLISWGCSTMTPASKAINAAEDQGYTHVSLVDKGIVWPFGDCDTKSDNARFVLEGVNPQGKTVEMVWCAGVFKGATYRGRP